MNNLKVGTRLAACFLAIFVGCSAVAAWQLWQLNKLRNFSAETTKVSWPNAANAYESINAIHDIARGMFSMLLSNDETTTKKLHESIRVQREKVTVELAKMERNATTPEARELLKKARVARKAYGESHIKFLDLASAGMKDDAKDVLVEETMGLQKAFIDAMLEYSAYQAKHMAHANQDAEAIYIESRDHTIAVIFFGFVVASALAYFVTRGITRPLHRSVEVAKAIAAGDLTSTIEVKSKDETGQLLQALKGMNQNLANLIGDVRSGADSISTASSEILAGNMDLSRRTEEQAASLEETASSMEELTSTVKQNAENARQANQLAIGAADVATKGGAVVSQVVTTMGSINDSARKIVDIISVIDGIAFQTNILALNAAVEAARAGEQGRGFAVVASEVRNLAQRSAAAAKEIKTLISDSVEKVDTGNKLVEQAGHTMDEVVTSIKRVTDIMAEITAASLEQSSGIEQVNTAVNQMDNVTQQNAALVEEATAASESLEEQAERLASAIAVFKLQRNEDGYDGEGETFDGDRAAQAGQVQAAKRFTGLLTTEKPTPELAEA